jgi:hypothetical protein
VLRQIALISETPKVSAEELADVAAALNQQVVTDFGPAWQIDAMVAAYPSLADKPPEFWPIIVRENVDQSAHGVHHDPQDQPFAVVEWNAGWSLWASHECLEMLADPWGRQLVAGPSLKPEQGTVQYLVEVCDPCQNVLFSYPIGGHNVSDFYLRNYFDAALNPAASYSCKGSLTAPRQVLPGGYLTWYEPTSDTWWQAQYTDQLRIIPADDVGKYLATNGGSLRGAVDRVTQVPRPTRGLDEHHELVAKSRRVRELARVASERKAHQLHEHIKRLSSSSPPPPPSL